MKQIAIEAKKREMGKKERNLIRKEGGIPCVVYGKDITSFCISVNERTFEKELHAHGMNALFNLVIDKDQYTAMIAEIQREPLSKKIKHIDFHKVALDTAVTATVPVHLDGDCKGVREGAILEQLMWEIEIEALPLNVPDHIVVDVTNLGLGEELKVAELKAPEGVSFVSPADEVVVIAAKPKKEEEETTETAEATAEPQVIKKGKEEEEK